jgi:hypothetical protein
VRGEIDSSKTVAVYMRDYRIGEDGVGGGWDVGCYAVEVWMRCLIISKERSLTSRMGGKSSGIRGSLVGLQQSFVT